MVRARARFGTLVGQSVAVRLMAAACATLLWVGAAQAFSSPQTKCDSARITAWAKFQSCTSSTFAKFLVGPLTFDWDKRLAQCRHSYFNNWMKFQHKATLADSTCIGTRYTDNGDQTVTDNLSGLVWEKKDNSGGIHDQANTYTWSTENSDLHYPRENGTVFTGFFSTLNGGAGFGGANGWRLPTLAELETTVTDGCSSPPCIDPALGPVNTIADTHTIYWSATRRDFGFTWGLDYSTVFSTTWSFPDASENWARAVRGGL